MTLAQRWTVATAVAWAFCAPAAAEDWKLVFEDDFERAEPGEMYRLKGEALRIENGRLLLVGSGAVVLIERPLAMDVRLEFEAAAWPERLACDLSVTLNSNPDGMWQYLLGFGARSNRANHLIGPGVRVVDEHPPFLIEQGRTYRMVAQREGRTITYTVDGTRILEGGGELVGGPMFNRAGFVTWGGMYVDNLKVYERAQPHPDTPRYLESLPGLPLEREGRTVKALVPVPPEAAAALEALNRGEYELAREAFTALSDVRLRLAGLAHLYGDLNYHERPVYGDLGTSVDFGELGAFASLWEREAAARPGDEVLQAYLPAARSFGRLVLNRQGANDALVLVGVGPRGNPFYHKAMLYRARYTYWNGAESGSEPLKSLARGWMRELLDIWPDNRVLNEYAGRPVPWGEELNADPQRHPAWAAYLREVYARELAVLERMCTARQMPDGQFGGGWGDDVEMMRRWVPIAAVSNCADKVLEGIERLAEGIWTHECADGYSREIGDVEHSAEPSADTFPTMLLLRYGDPRYYAFNLRSARTIRERFMGLDAHGYPRFRSTEFGADGVHESLIAGGDTGYHARAMKHFLWLAWHGNQEARDWLVRWADGWRRAAMIDEPTKPAGIFPGTLWYPGGDYNCPSGEPWYSPRAANYYGPIGLPLKLHGTMLAAYGLTGDRRFLLPFQRMMDLATAGPLVRGPTEPGSREWNLAEAAHQASPQLTALYRHLTGEGVYDEYTRRSGSAPLLYRIDRDLQRYLDRFKGAAESLRHNLWFMTTEVQSTDRLYLPAVEDLWGAYCGAVSMTVDEDYPTFAVTYETPSPDFAALVVDQSPTRLRIWFYTFWDQPVEIVLRPWGLTPGRYLLTQGAILPGEHPAQRRYAWGRPVEMDILHRARKVRVTLPPATEVAVDLRLEEAAGVPARAADLAVHSRDLRREGLRLRGLVHNIGNAPANGAFVEAQFQGSAGWKPGPRVRVADLPPPANFEPSSAGFALDLPAEAARAPVRVVVDPGDGLYELSEDNNMAPATGPAD